MTDEEAFNRARAEADASFPLPEQSPGIIAVQFGIFAVLCFLCFEILLPVVGFWWAEALSVAVAALVGWADTSRKVRANSRAFFNLYRAYREHTKLDT